MKKHTLIYMLLISILLPFGCKILDSKITPENQCLLVRSGVSIGLSSVLDKQKRKSPEKFDLYSKEIVQLIEKEIIPVLEKKKEKISLKEWEEIIDKLTEKMSPQERLIIKNAILNIYSRIEIPKQEKGYVGERVIYMFKCVLNGVLDAFRSFSIPSKGLDKKPLSEEIRKACEDCKK